MVTKRTEIEWVNHASFVVRHGESSLLCDPWLTGTAFNHGWELLVPSVHEASQLIKGVSALWISHVHPDHFAPRSLKAAPKEVRRQTPVYFQKTMDQQVAKFCRGLGFPVTEVRDGARVEVTPDMRLTVGRVPFYDSWSLVETPDARILNLNDCVLNRPKDLERLADRIGRVDVVLTQFSYANWVGGPDDSAQRREAAAEKLDWVRAQLRAFKPTFTIPFASFVVFAHQENHYLNDERNTVQDAVEVIQECNITPVVLFPGDTWTVGDPCDPSVAMKRYEAAWDASSRPKLTSDPVSVEDLEYLAQAAVKRLAKRNNRLLLRAAARLGIGKPLVVNLLDHPGRVRFSPTHGLDLLEGDGPADIGMSSQSLAYTLRYDWGADTLSVNGRFSASPTGYRKMLRTFGPALLNNNGRALSLKLVLDPWWVRRAFDRFILRAS